MKKTESKSGLKSTIYLTIATIIAIIGILFITSQMFSRVELSNTKKQSINIAQLKIASNEVARNSLTAISRSSQEERKSKKESTDEQNKKAETENEKEKTAKNEEKNNIKSKKESNEKKSTKNEKENSKKIEKTSSKKKKNEENKKTKKVETTNKKSTTKKVSISKVKISRTMDLSKRTGLSREDFIKLISGVKADTSGFFEKNAGKIYDLCEKYSINEIFFCGLISAESGWNIASNHRKTHNYISLMSGGKLIKYNSVSEGLEVAAQKLHYNYLTPGGKFYHGKTLSGVKTCFCPSSGWVDLVYGRMRQIL